MNDLINVTLNENQEPFEIKETTINHSDGHISIDKTPKITGKGQLYFADKLLNNNDIA